MYLTFDYGALFGDYGYLLNIIRTFLLTLVMLLITIVVYAKYGTKKSQDTGRRALTEKEFVKAEKERENAGGKEETGYSERDEIGHENEGSDDSDDDE